MMKTKLREIAGSPRFILFATTLLAIVTFVTGRYYGLTRIDWPGWLQAIGSVWAILVAVWVSWHQAEAHERREKQKEADELAGLLNSFRTELSCMFDRIHDLYGADLEAIEPGQPFASHLPVPDDPFVIYNALLPKLGTIRDDVVREQIVRTYREANGFFLTIHLHNRLANAWYLRDESAGEQFSRQRYDDLVGYSPVLKTGYSNAKNAVAKLLPLLG